MRWLIDHPINWKAHPHSILDSGIDLKFVMHEMGKKKSLLEEYFTNNAKQEAELEGRWTVSIPLHCLIRMLIEVH
jgi:hypothetical protein